jgi:hypothetical protein
MIKVFNSAYGRNSEAREIQMDEVTVHTIKLDYDGAPYMLFEHKDYPLGALRAQFRNDVWECDLD